MTVHLDPYCSVQYNYVYFNFSLRTDHKRHTMALQCHMTEAIRRHLLVTIAL